MLRKIDFFGSKTLETVSVIQIDFNLFRPSRDEGDASNVTNVASEHGVHHLCGHLTFTLSSIGIENYFRLF